MNREQKTALVEELSEQIRSAEAIFAVDYRGISVADAAALRGRLREAQTRFRVVKNSLSERASDQAGAQELKPVLEGPTALAFVSGDAALAAKALSDAARTLGTLEFKGGLMNGSPVSAEQIQSIARLPAREVLHGQLVGTIAAPLSGLVRTLNALIAGVAIQLQQIAEQGLVGAGASSDSEAPAAPEAGTSSAPEASAPSETEPSAEASTREASGADDGPPSAEVEEAEADDGPPSAEGEEAAAEEVPAETAEEPPPAETAAEPAPAEGEPESSEQTEPEPASDAEASEQ